MPRAPKKISSLAKLRKLVGFTQKEFAQLSGLTPASYQQLELGKFPMSIFVAIRLMSATGASISLLIRQPDSIAKREFLGLDWRGREYTEKSFGEWQVLQSKEALVAPTSEAIKKLVDLYLTNAASRGNLCEEALSIVVSLMQRDMGTESEATGDDELYVSHLLENVVSALTGETKWIANCFLDGAKKPTK